MKKFFSKAAVQATAAVIGIAFFIGGVVTLAIYAPKDHFHTASSLVERDGQPQVHVYYWETRGKSLHVRYHENHFYPVGKLSAKLVDVAGQQIPCITLRTTANNELTLGARSTVCTHTDTLPGVHRFTIRIAGKLVRCGFGHGNLGCDWNAAGHPQLVKPVLVKTDANRDGASLIAVALPVKVAGKTVTCVARDVYILAQLDCDLPDNGDPAVLNHIKHGIDGEYGDGGAYPISNATIGITD